MSWKIRIERGNLSFSAAHFITLEGTYEPLHGHNYGVSAEITSDNLTDDSYVLDFGVVKAIVRSLIAEVNHHFLLPLNNPHLDICSTDREWEIRMGDGARFVLPRASVVALDVDNATAERLAEYFAGRLVAELHQRGVRHLGIVTVGIAETEMQTAYFSTRCDRA